MSRTASQSHVGESWPISQATHSLGMGVVVALRRCSAHDLITRLQRDEIDSRDPSPAGAASGQADLCWTPV